jgi:aldehyde dehydrogenase (NAD+)
MREKLNFYIDGKWVAPAKPRTHDVINPANEEPCGRISLGSADDVNQEGVRHRVTNHRR